MRGQSNNGDDRARVKLKLDDGRPNAFIVTTKRKNQANPTFTGRLTLIFQSCGTNGKFD
jgi:hypothetical protein